MIGVADEQMSKNAYERIPLCHIIFRYVFTIYCIYK